jgi:SAM-dependent methyltransferase
MTQRSHNKQEQIDKSEAHRHWEAAAPGWAKWEDTIARWTEPATDALLDIAGIRAGVRVLDLACGAGSQTLSAARRVGPRGQVVASDISETMLQHVQANARAAGLDNISTLVGPAEDLQVTAGEFDAVICRFGLMLFAEPVKALAMARRALRPGGELAIVVFTTPTTNPFMAKPMQILLRHAGKAAPTPGQPGIFSLGAPGVVERLFTQGGFTDFVKHELALRFELASSAQALQMMQEAFGVYRAAVSDLSDAARAAAWAEVFEALKAFETDGRFVAPSEVLVAAGAKAT